MATLSFWTKIGQLAIDVAIIPVFVSAHLNKNIAISVFNINFLFVLNLFYTIERQKKNWGQYTPSWNHRRFMTTMELGNRDVNRTKQRRQMP